MSKNKDAIPVVEADYDSIRIRIRGIVHVYMDRAQLVSFQSWRDSPKNFSVEYTFKDGASMWTEYDTEEKWLAVLSGLDAINLRQRT